MGLLVKYGILPCGVEVNNVYMTFSNFPVYIMPQLDGKYSIRGTYSVYPNENTQRTVRETNIEFDIQVSDVSAPLHQLLYDQLKKIYTNSTSFN